MEIDDKLRRYLNQVRHHHPANTKGGSSHSLFQKNKYPIKTTTNINNSRNLLLRSTDPKNVRTIIPFPPVHFLPLPRA